MDNKTRPKTLQLAIVQELALDKSGKEVWSHKCLLCQYALSGTEEKIKNQKCPRCGAEIKDQKGEKQYRREDFIGLLNLLNRFDSRLYDIKGYKMYLKVKDHLFADWSKEAKTIDLSLDEATFLKTYLKDLVERSTKEQARGTPVTQPLQEFEMRTLCGILEQLGE